MRCRLSPSRSISTHSGPGARRDRLSMMEPILPRPRHPTGGPRLDQGHLPLGFRGGPNVLASPRDRTVAGRYPSGHLRKRAT